MASKKTSAKLIGMDWDFPSMWNLAITSLPERPMQKRDHIWSSEMGGDAYSRYLKMWAHPMSNPPGDQARRKFIMGHITEWIVEMILSATGILQAKQLRGEVQLPGLLKVSGKFDFIAGGNIDWKKAREQMEMIQKVFAVSLSDMPPIILHAITHVLNRMEKMFTLVPIKEYIIEVKSVSRMIMNLIIKSEAPRPRHTFQPLHYLLCNKEIKEAQLLYISKDDARMEGFIITPTKPLCKLYHDDVKMITDCYNNSGKNYMKNLPQKEREVIFEEDSFSFQKNMNVQYSNYLTMGWGYSDPEAFDEAWTKVKTSWNRVFKRHVLEGTSVERIVKGKPTMSVHKLTVSNLEVIREATKYFPNWDELVHKAKKSGAFEKADELEEDAA